VPPFAKSRFRQKLSQIFISRIMLRSTITSLRKFGGFIAVRWLEGSLDTASVH